MKNIKWLVCEAIKSLPSIAVWMVVFAASASADDLDKQLEAIDDRLAEKQLSALEEALEDAEGLAVDLLREGSDAKRATDRVAALRAEVDRLKKTLDPGAKKELYGLTREFEAADNQCNGWWWVRKDSPEEKRAFYRLNTNDKKFRHLFMQNGKPVEVPKFTFDYKVLGAREDDANILMIRMRFAKQFSDENEGEAGTYLFNRETKQIDGGNGWIGIPRQK